MSTALHVHTKAGWIRHPVTGRIVLGSPEDARLDVPPVAGPGVWALQVALRTGLPVNPSGALETVSGPELDELQRRTNDAWIVPVYRIILDSPWLIFRFYGDLCYRLTRLYTSVHSILRIGGFGEVPHEALGLTGRNSACSLVAACLQPGSVVVFGGISNRAIWADQILIQHNAGIDVVDNLSSLNLPVEHHGAW